MQHTCLFSYSEVAKIVGIALGALGALFIVIVAVLGIIASIPYLLRHYKKIQSLRKEILSTLCCLFIFLYLYR